MRNIILLIIIALFTNIYSQNFEAINNLKQELETKDNDLEKINILLEISKAYSNNSFKLAEQYANKAQIIASIINNDSVLIRIYRIRGGLKQYKGELDSAIFFYNKALIYSKKINNELEIARTSANLASIYALDKQLEKAENILLSAVTTLEKHNDTTTVLQVYNNLGMVYRLQHKYEKAINYYNKVIVFTDTNSVRYGSVLSNLAEVYFYSNDTNKAVNNYKKAINIFEINDSKYNTGITYERLSYLYLEQKNYEKAKLYALQAETIAKEIDTKSLLFHTYNLLVQIERKQGNLNNALKYYDLYVEISDTLNLIKRDKLLNELKIQYDVEIKDIQLQKNIVEIRNKTNFLYLLTGGILISLIFVVFILLQLKKINKAYKDLAQQNMNAVTVEEELIELKQLGIKPNNESTNENSDLIDRIIDQVENKKAYLDPSLTIFKFADDLGTNKTYVSQEINKHFNKNFSIFINDYRVAEARRLMTVPDYYNLTLAAISEKAGFNSISVFNRSFKRVTGITPSFFLKSVKNNN